MSFMDKIKSLFSGGSSGEADAHAGHDHPHEPAAPAMPPADPAGMPTSDAPVLDEPIGGESEDRPA